MWARPPPQPPSQASQLRLEGKVLVLLRGLPGSGKSTLARALLEHNRGGVILSTDDYFIVNGEYKFDLSVLGEAHDWNHDRARLAFEKGANPIIIDNTNMCGWEMRPYVVQALKHDYKVYFREPDTWWKYKPRELERRTKHGVPLERIKHMLSGYERFVTVKSIMGSQMPERKQTVATGELLKPEMASPSSSIDPTKHKEVPYSVVYEKSTQVEEKEFGTSEDMTENLLILRRHFKQIQERGSLGLMRKKRMMVLV
uniref:NEDD4-binding protein 2-like 2 n=1 Tax=Knipowitschia caucasica TaxID=637954 RepID=A0AAV2LP47_KNICA